MPTKIFVNLPVKDLERSMSFFTRLGFSFNSEFTDEKAGCLVISDDIYVMLLTEEFFKTFTKKEIADATKTTEVILALSADSVKAVNDLVNKATKAGGKTYRESEDHGWMYAWSFEDLDGHQWEIVYMNENEKETSDPSAK